MPGNMFGQPVAGYGWSNGGDLSVKEIQTDGVVRIDETTTPGAVVNKGKIYTKSDNKLYFQDGAGVEHEVAYVP